MPEELGPPAVADTADPRSWLANLSGRLAARNAAVKRCEDYYEGRHRLAFAGRKFQEAFGGLFDAFADNWCEVVVDAVEERLNIEGFRFGSSPQADKDAWEVWQRNLLDADSQLAHTDSLVGGYGYALVWATEEGAPLITVESPLEAIVAHEPGSRRQRRAALKQWCDDDGRVYACVYLPDGLYKYRSKAKAATAGPLAAEEMRQPNFWEKYELTTEEWPLQLPTGEAIPLVPLYNRPRTRRAGQGQSELASVIPLQDAVNKLLTDLLVASEFGAYRQRWATGLELETDAEGNKVFPFKHGPGYVWTIEAGDEEGGAGPRFGEFGETNLSNIVTAVGMVVQHIASQSRTPPHYLTAAADRLSGESIKAAETGLVAKCHRKMRHLGESWEEVMRLAFAVTDDSRAEEWQAETIWADPESRTEAEHVDATLKKKSINVPDQQLWEDLGYSPQTIARFKAMRAGDALLGLGPPQPAALPPGGERPAPPPPPALPAPAER